MQFHEFAKLLYSRRQRSLKHPEEEGFSKNGSGVMQIIIKAKVFVHTSRGIFSLKEQMIFYADQNPNGKSTEAQIVRRGLWKPHVVGWLWTTLGNERIWLAKVTPMEQVSFNTGFVTDKTGVFHLNRSEVPECVARTNESVNNFTFENDSKRELVPSVHQRLSIG